MLYIFEVLFTTTVSLIYFKYYKPIISIKYLFHISSKGLCTHSIIDVAVSLNKHDSWDLIRKHFYIYFPLSLYTCSVVEVLHIPWTQTRVNTTIFLATSRESKSSVYLILHTQTQFGNSHVHFYIIIPPSLKGPILLLHLLLARGM